MADEKQNEPSPSSSTQTARLTNAESFPLLFNQRYQTGRSASTVTAHSYISHSSPKSESELRRIKIGQYIFITMLILSASFLIFFPPAYNHFMNLDKIKKATETIQRNRYLEKLKCQCETKGGHHREKALEVNFGIRTLSGAYTVPLTLEGSTCAPILKSNVSECAEWGPNNRTKGACAYSRLLGTVHSIFADIKHHQQ